MNIYKHYYDSKTLTVLLTNVLFMGLKVSDVFNTVNTKCVFYSAYLTNKVQYNDVDPDKKLKSSDVLTAEMNEQKTNEIIMT